MTTVAEERDLRTGCAARKSLSGVHRRIGIPFGIDHTVSAVAVYTHNTLFEINVILHKRYRLNFDVLLSKIMIKTTCSAGA